MLFHYELTNFKAFGKTQIIPIRPITLIYGPNSSGKSSILQSWLLLKQTLEDSAGVNTILLPQGKLTNLGNYREFIHSHDVSSSFSIKVMFELEDQPSLGLGIKFAYNQETSSPVLTEIDVFQEDCQTPVVTYATEDENPILNVSKVYSEHPFWQGWWQDFQQRLPDAFFKQVNRTVGTYDRFKSVSANQKKRIAAALKKQLALLQEELEKNPPEEISESTSDCIDEIETLIDLDQCFKSYTLSDAIQGFLDVIPFYSGLSFHNFLPKSTVLYEEDESLLWKWKIKHLLQLHQSLENQEKLDNLTLKTANRLRTFLTNLIYIAPLRDYPERLYTFSGNLTEQVGKTGKGIADLLFKREDVLEKLNKKFEAFDLRYRVKTVKFLNKDDNQISDIFTIRLVDKVTEIDVSLLDVGFGISQILPVIVQSIASRGKTIAIEQPEIHLHPRLQAELADVFIESALGDAQNTFIIETHSENLLLRIMRRMRETAKGELPSGYPSVTPDQICVLYVDVNSKGDSSFIQELPLNSRGELIKAWPRGFFEENVEDIFA